MIENETSRPSSVIREEISDLTRYLAALPSEVRQSGAFASYDQRLMNLEKELSDKLISDLSSVALFQNQTAKSFRLIESEGEKYRFIERIAKDGKEYHIRMVSKFDRQANLLQYSTIAASITSIVTLGVASAFAVVPVVVTTVLAGALPFFRLSSKIRLEQKLADDFTWIESELVKFENKKLPAQEEYILIEHLSERVEKITSEYKGELQEHSSRLLNK